MRQKVDIAVIIPTYNRAASLALAIESLLHQAADGIAYEVVVVDNNSSDNTRTVVERYLRNYDNVRYFIEDSQGAGLARNAGAVNTTAEILAFMDDDVQARPDWIARLKQTFERDSAVMFAGGKVLPEWKSPPPEWLTKEHWSPLALVDYGDEHFVVNLRRQICLVSANLGVRRCVVEKVGLFSPDFRRCEDHELELRLLRAGIDGLYVPDLVVTVDVPEERLSKKYHRMWYTEHGTLMARMRAYDTLAMSDGSVRTDPGIVRLFGAPTHIYRELLRDLIGLIRSWLKRRESDTFLFELRIRDTLEYVRETHRLATAESRLSFVEEVVNATRQLVHKKFGRRRDGVETALKRTNVHHRGQ